ncbi:MAG: AMP-binding protein [Gallionella sp.]|nr:AMP-binding protein [Gallionella sp.]
MLPLILHQSPEDIVAWRADGAVTRQQFLFEVDQLAAQLPTGEHLLNMCRDRYRFSVGLAAAMVSGKVSLLPSAHTPEMLRQIRGLAPDVFCLTDNELCAQDLPQVQYPAMGACPASALAVPQIKAAQRIAVVFTSGSTGIPQPHPKTWGALVSSVQAEIARLGVERDCTLIGTVPPQHMYGFETTILMAWLSGCALSHAQPFYPADICCALEAVPAPRVLVSSPLHLRALIASGLVLPDIKQVVSATAPLPLKLAQDIESGFHAPLFEIYGSTETGQIAARRPAHGPAWQLFPGIKLTVDGECARAHGAHIGEPVALSDQIEPLTDEHFLLHGRMADLVNIAGKRHSLASLDHLLGSIPGVVDGAFYMPDETGHITRLAACVVAPRMTPSTLLSALREHIDPVFLPRPLLFVDALPRNSTGKLPRSALQALFQSHE